MHFNFSVVGQAINNNVGNKYKSLQKELSCWSGDQQQLGIEDIVTNAQ